jgi:glutathione peroxidase
MSVFKTVKQLAKHLFASKHYTTPSQYKPEMGTIYDLKIKDVDGNDFNLTQYKGYVLLICNVASECGYTKCGYQFLVEEHKKYADRKFQVLAFPCNQFGAQEPGGPADIKDFAKTFNADFPILEKGDVNGDHTHSLWKYLKSVFPGDVSWNFQSWYIIDENGVPVARFTKDPYPDIDAAIKQVLDARDAHAQGTTGDSTASEATTTTTIDSAVENPRAL